MKNTSGFTHWVIVILISIMAVGLVGVAWYYEENKEEGTSTTNINTESNQNVNGNYNANTETTTNSNTSINSNLSTNANVNIQTQPPKNPSLTLDDQKWHTIQLDTQQGYTITLSIPEQWTYFQYLDGLIEGRSLISTSGLTNIPTSNVYFTLRYYNNDNDSFDEWIDKHQFEFQLPQWGGRQYYESEIKYDELTFRKFVFENGGGGGFFFIPIGNDIFEIAARLSDDEESKKILSKILESFKFNIDNDTTDSLTGWRTFSQNHLGISFDYPQLPGELTFQYSGNLENSTASYFYWGVERSDLRGKTYPFAAGVGVNKRNSGDPFISDIASWQYINDRYVVYMAGGNTFNVVPIKIIQRTDGLEALVFNPNNNFPRFSKNAEGPFNPTKADRVAVLKLPEEYLRSIKVITLYFYDETSENEIERVINSIVFHNK